MAASDDLKAKAFPPFSDEEIKGFNEVYPDIDEVSSGMTADEIEVHRRFLATIAARDKTIERLRGTIKQVQIHIELHPDDWPASVHDRIERDGKE